VETASFSKKYMTVIDALIDIFRTPDIESAMSALTDWATTAVSVTIPPPSLFMLSTQQNEFVGVFGEKKKSTNPTTQKFSEDRHVIGKRGELIIGFLEWDAPIASMDSKNRDVISAVIEEIYRRRYIDNFLRNIQKTIDFTNQDTYFRETAKLLSNSLNMEMVAIRQINSHDYLNCRAFFHYPDQIRERVDFDGANLPLPFREMISETKLLISENRTEQHVVKFEIVDPKNLDRYGFLLKDNSLKNVKAFAIFPIVFDDEFFGVVSCSTTAPFNFSSIERVAVETAMQLIGVAISNFLKFHEAKRMTDVIHDQLFSTTELEIAQSARHELQNIETEQSLHIDELEALTRTVKDRRIIETISKLGGTIDKLGFSISKLRYSGVHAAPKLKETSVKNIWNEAINLMQERLSIENIKPRYVGSSLEGYYYDDWLREAFLNLLFNSIDAFHDRPRSGRSITLVVQKESEAKLSHVLDYSDNAGGIAFSKLNVPEPIKDANPGMGQEQLIFQPKVTSKKSKKGAGWGLYLVRQALKLHNGSISLRSNTKDGCTFRIQIQKNLQEQSIKKVNNK
jgi:signal transduction histidine kinase